jgi:uncharacterized protein involved in cysteine biosynthesis
MALQKKVNIALLGLINPLYGLYVIYKNPKFLLHIFLILLINFLIFLLLIFGVLAIGSQLSAAIIQILRIDNNAAGTVIATLIQSTILLVSIFIYLNLFITISSIVNAPIIGDLADRLVTKRSGLKMMDMSPFKLVLYSIRFELSKLSLQLVILLFTSLLNLIPGIGSIIFIAINLVSLILFSGLDISEPILMRLNEDFFGKIKFVVSHPGLWPALLVSGILNTIPVVNLIMLPLNLCAGIMLVISTIEQENLNVKSKNI